MASAAPQASRVLSGSALPFVVDGGAPHPPLRVLESQRKLAAHRLQHAQGLGHYFRADSIARQHRNS